MSRVVIVFGVVFMLMGCSIVNSLRLRNSNDHLEPLWPNDVQEVKLSTHYLGEKPYVEVTLNGIQGFKFLVDSGASVTIVMDTPKIKALSLERGYDLKMGGWGDQERSPAYQTSVNSLNLAGVNFEAVNLAFLPTSTSKYYLDPNEAVYDGVIGHDIMHHFSWLFDKNNNKIIISKLPFEAPSNATTLAFDTFFSKIDVEGEIDFGNGQKANHEFIVDTGSRHYIKVTTAFLETKDIELTQKSVTAVDFGLSGRAVHQRVTVPQVRFSELEIPNVKTNLIGGDFEDDFSFIGSALLNQFVSVIDYHSDKIHLIPYANQPFKTKYNLLGLELRKLTSGNFIVRYVFPELASAKYDFEEGDIITSINGKQSSEISLYDWLEISAEPAQYVLCRERQTEACFTVESQPIEGYSVPAKLSVAQD